MSLEFIIIIIVVSYLRKRLQMSLTMPEWNRRFLWLLYGSVGLLILQVSVPRFNAVGNWISIAVLGLLLYIIYKEKVFESERFLVTALLPLLGVLLFEDTIILISRSFYDKWKSWIDPLHAFAVIWALGTWIVTRKQRSELKKAREKAYEEEQNNRIISQMKARLEVQVAERTAALTRQKEELEHTLTELKSTQAQLIQSEKMASLGELTAGIAHEIQNPLNFVNNFSEVNKELLEELKLAIDKGSMGEVKALADDIIENEQKINHHGKRADGIVKSMLQHSRKSTGQKELTDINALCDEYLRLSFHGLRAKDKSFNAKFKTDFDTAAGKINIMPQEIGRVLLNLLNNAFYAVNEKKQEGIQNYEPAVTVQTKKTGNSVSITVSDNGNGIPEKIKDKIFQPFFTTKQTGQGTGLGLSLSFDIIKSHGGNINMETREKEGTKFIITLPT
ncbi:MAG TPA: ATP-binding protein [Puia sp.]|nr:ATP-binding protein [Puia sp.]HVZ96230.1 ATP-binding protein [Chitinophagaceae bacterium]